MTAALLCFRHERTVNQTIRRQQDEAYKESLRADQEKERKRREEQELQARKEMEERNKVLEEQKRKEVGNILESI